MKTLIFDLSEVLISGLVGIEYELVEILGKTPDEILKSFTGKHLDSLCCGFISEDDYLYKVKEINGGNISIKELKKIIRKNFHRKIEGMDDFIKRVKANYNIVLYSDNAIEWVEYILSIHKFLSVFHKHIYSYDIGGRKSSSVSFLKLIDLLEISTDLCIFIDDNNENVNAARSIGIMSFQFTTREKLTCDLADVNIII